MDLNCRWCKEVKEFINSNNWNESLPEGDGPRNCHIEATYFTQKFFILLLEFAGVNGFKIGEKKTKISMGEEPSKVSLSFDVMNNPKPWEKNLYRLGSIAAKNNCDCENWKNLTHTIGNITVIPNWKIKKRHLQLKHNDLAERWDFLLKYCKESWNDFSLVDMGITFKKYMQVTCQEMYYEELWDEIISIIPRLERITDEELIKLKEKWDKRIEEEELQLISFGEKTINLEINPIIDKIEKLIELRGRLIFACIKCMLMKTKIHSGAYAPDLNNIK